MSTEQKHDFTQLSSPLQLHQGAITLPNRSIIANMTRDRGAVPGNDQAQYYASFDAGLIRTESTSIEAQGYEFTHAPGIYSEEQVQGWLAVTKAVQAKGRAIFCQLNHIGRVAHPALQDNRPCVAPSAVTARGGKFRTLDGQPGYVAPVAIEDPKPIVALFKQAAANAKRAGFDGVEIHGASGYLVNQFLDIGANKREDAYGGSAENRNRFLLEVLDAVIEVFGAGRVGLKLSPFCSYNDMGEGYTVETLLEQYKLLLEELNKRPLAFIEVVRFQPWLDAHERKLDGNVDVLRAVYQGTFFVGGGFSSEEGEQWLKEKRADGIVYGRPYLFNPDLLHRFVSGTALRDVDYSTLYGWQQPPRPRTYGYTTFEL